MTGVQTCALPICAIYGQFLNYVGYSSSNWFVAPFYPFVALSTIKKWLPKSEEQVRKKKEKKLRKQQKKEKKRKKKATRDRKVLGKMILKPDDKKKKKGKKKKKSFVERKQEEKLKGILKKSSLFLQKLEWYIEQSEYNHALGLLYNRIKRLVGKKLGDVKDTEIIVDAIVDRFPNTNHKKLQDFFRNMNRITGQSGRKLKVTRQESFEKIYFEMVSVQEYLERL